MRRAALAVPALLGLLLLTSCSGEPAAPQPPDSDSITLTFENGQAPPVERVEVAVGEEIELVVKADEAGSLHVHSQPEQELEYTSGTTTLTLTIEQPGVVDVESHELEATVLQLEVS